MSKERAYGSGMSQEKATKFLVIGIILAISFGSLLLISNSMASQADTWKNYQENINVDGYNRGLYGPAENMTNWYNIRMQWLWMKQQPLYLGNVSLIGVNIGLLLVFIGFIGFATNNQMDEHTRRTCIIIAGVIIFVLMISFVGVLNISIG